MEFEEPTFLDFTCPHCATEISYPDLYQGTLQPCPNCGECMTVPRSEGQPGRKLPFPLETPRLILRPLRPTDWKDLLEYHGDPSFFEHDARLPMDEEQVCHWLEQESAPKWTDRQTGVSLAVQEKASEKVIGDVWFRLVDEGHHQAELACSIHPQFQRRGLGGEALTAMITVCFRDIGLHRIIARCDSRNTAARALLRRVGLREEGEFLQDQWVKGQWINTVWHALLREEGPKDHSQ